MGDLRVELDAVAASVPEGLDREGFAFCQKFGPGGQMTSFPVPLIDVVGP